MTSDTLPIYQSVVAETGIVPDQVYARCLSLASFQFDSRPVRRMTTPQVGVKPATTKRRKLKR